MIMVSGSPFTQTHRYSGSLSLEESRGRRVIKIGLIKTDLTLSCELISAAGVSACRLLNAEWGILPHNVMVDVFWMILEGLVDRES